MEKREGYKKTEIGWIPEDWDTKRIDEIAEVLLSNVDKKSSTNEINVLLCNYMDVFHNDYIASSMPFMKATATLQEIEKFSLIKNDVLLTKDSETQEEIAQSAVVSEELEGVLCGYHLAILRPYQNHIAGRFLMNTIKSPAVHNYFVKLTNGVTRFGLNKASINGAIVPFPPLPEQKKIASILTTVDDKISSIEHQIQQTEQLKKGLMEKLLTEGIGHTEFKETKIGRIPKGWDVKLLKSVASIERGKFQHRPRNDPRFYGGEFPFVQTGDVGKSKGRLNEYSQTLNEKGLTKSKLFPKGTIIITIAANIGDTAIASFDVAFPDSLVGIIAGSKIDSIFLELFLRTQKAYLNKLATVNAQKNINLETLRPLSIPLPPIEEQKQIASILSTVDDKIEVLTQKKTQYQTLKKGLSQQLLTGQMRVKI